MDNILLKLEGKLAHNFSGHMFMLNCGIMVSERHTNNHKERISRNRF